MSLAGRPSERRKKDVLLPLLGPLDGGRIPGGCDECDAYQTTEQMQPGMWVIHVHHDDDCPFYAGVRERDPDDAVGQYLDAVRKGTA